ncbi:MAG: hypothetical protein IJF78_02135 [Clostridia bacterium]|nr:hypothetical protein [Clostridia bacterium]
MSITVKFMPPEVGIFTPDIQTDKPELFTGSAPINHYNGYLRPQNNKAARELGDKCAAEMKASIIADFEKNEAYCTRHPEDHVDMMVHVSTFAIIDGYIYMTYYANTGTTAEDPFYQESRFAFCPCDDPSDMTIVKLLKAGEKLDGKTIDRVYDTILLRKDDDVLYLMWTASADGLYYRFYCTYTISTATLSPIRPNRFKVGDVTNDFSISGMITALSANGIAHKSMWSDIGIMQKLTTREENGELWYYTGAYSGNFNCIIKSRDFITWEYVSTPDFINESLWENAVYVIGDKIYYFVRQDECMQGFLTCYDLTNDTWAAPCLIRDAQSRSDFILYKDELYLIHAPIDRNGFGIVKVNQEDLGKSTPVLVADMHDSLFYPYTDLYGEYAYMSYTINRKHIRLSRFKLENYLG